MDTNITIGTLGAIASVLFAYIGYQRGLKSDSRKDGTVSGQLLSDIGYIKSSLDDMKRKQESVEERYFDLSMRVGKVEESTKSAHNRIDEFKHTWEELR